MHSEDRCNETNMETIGKDTLERGDLLALGKEEGDFCIRQKFRLGFKGSD